MSLEFLKIHAEKLFHKFNLKQNNAISDKNNELFLIEKKINDLNLDAQRLQGLIKIEKNKINKLRESFDKDIVNIIRSSVEIIESQEYSFEQEVSHLAAKEDRKLIMSTTNTFFAMQHKRINTINLHTNELSSINFNLKLFNQRKNEIHTEIQNILKEQDDKKLAHGNILNQIKFMNAYILGTTNDYKNQKTALEQKSMSEEAISTTLKKDFDGRFNAITEGLKEIYNNSNSLFAVTINSISPPMNLPYNRDISSNNFQHNLFLENNAHNIHSLKNQENNASYSGRYNSYNGDGDLLVTKKIKPEIPQSSSVIKTSTMEKTESRTLEDIKVLLNNESKYKKQHGTFKKSKTPDSLCTTEFAELLNSVFKQDLKECLSKSLVNNRINWKIFANKIHYAGEPDNLKSYFRYHRPLLLDEVRSNTKSSIFDRKNNLGFFANPHDVSLSVEKNQKSQIDQEQKAPTDYSCDSFFSFK